MLNRENNKVTTSRNVRFLGPEPEYTSIAVRKNHEESTNEQSDITDPQIGENEPETPTIEETIQHNTRPQCDTGPPKHLNDYCLTARVDYAYAAIPCIPNTYDETVQSKAANKWKAAMDNEIKTLTDNKTWDLTPLPQNRTETKDDGFIHLNKGKNPVKYNTRHHTLHED